MRIIFIVPRFPPHIGGMTARAYRISKGLSLRGHEVTVYTSTHPQVPRIQEIEGLRVERYDRLHPAITRFIKTPIYPMPSMFKLLCNKKEIQKADIIQTFHFMSYVSFVGTCIKLLQKKPFALSPLVMHHYEFKEGMRSAYGRSGIKAFVSEWYLISYFLTLGVRILRFADFLAPQTTSEKDMLVSYGVDPEKIRVIPGSINVDHYRELPDSSRFRREYSIDDDEKLILFVGQPNLWKGIHHVILAMEEVSKKVDKARLVLVGPAVDKAYRQLRRFGSSSVRSRTLVVGPLLGEPLISAYSASDMLILTSKAELFGTVVVEALASGLPVISTRTGVAPDIIRHGKNGFFVEFGKVPEIAEAIVQVLLDENFKTEAERNRQTILKTYSSRREIESYEKAYYNIIS